MKGLRVAAAFAAIITVAATSHAQSSATYATVSPARADSSRVAAAPLPTDSSPVTASRASRSDLMHVANNAVSQRTDDSTQYENIVGALRVQSVSDGAGYLVLEDGTHWKVALEDRPRVQQWRAGDYVIVRLAPIVEDGDFRYRLVNGRDESDILVAFRGMAQAAD
ncbi:MAG: hypothetical protein ACREND_13540 [Gemmatimonadaceae bacterium]